jgi:hypothetical protein
MTVRILGESGANQLPGLTEALVADLEAGRIKVEELNEVQLRQLVEDEDVQGSFQAPAAVSAAPAPEVAPPATPPGEPPKPASSKPEGSDDLGELFREKANKLNQTEQELDRNRRALEETKRLLEETNKRLEESSSGTRSNKKLDDEGFVEDLATRLDRLERENADLRKVQSETLNSKVKTLEERDRETAAEKTFLEIETFQLRSPKMGIDLRTERPIREIDKEMSRIESLIGKENALKLQTDEAYRKQVEATGVRLPAEWEKWATISKLHAFKAKNGYPTYNSAFSDFSQDSGMIRRLVQDAALEASRATADKLIQSSQESAILPANSGSGAGSHLVADQKWTEEKAAKWMRDNPNPRTKEEVATQLEIMRWLDAQQE